MRWFVLKIVNKVLTIDRSIIDKILQYTTIMYGYYSMIVMLILGSRKERARSSLLEVDHVPPSEGGDIHRL